MQVRWPANSRLLLRNVGTRRYFCASYRALSSFFARLCAFIVEKFWTKVRPVLLEPFIGDPTKMKVKEAVKIKSEVEKPICSEMKPGSKYWLKFSGIKALTVDKINHRSSY